MTELCERYGISRMTGHKWLRRFRRDGVGALEDRCRAPLHCPHRTDPEVAEALVEARHRHSNWGACKLILWLLLPPHRGRQLQPIPARLPISTLYRDHPNEEELRTRLPRLRPARGHPH